MRWPLRWTDLLIETSKSPTGGLHSNINARPTLTALMLHDLSLYLTCIFILIFLCLLIRFCCLNPHIRAFVAAQAPKVKTLLRISSQPPPLSSHPEHGGDIPTTETATTDSR